MIAFLTTKDNTRLIGWLCSAPMTKVFVPRKFSCLFKNLTSLSSIGFKTYHILRNGVAEGKVLDPIPSMLGHPALFGKPQDM